MSIDKKADEKTDEAFLSRWARVKEEARVQEGHVPTHDDDFEKQNLQFALPAASGSRLAGDPHADRNPRSTTSIGGVLQPKVPEEARPERTLPNAPAVLPPLDSLTPQSDFSLFMAKGVDPQLRNQAMKKLFTDPRYNIMDRLDTYIDDYSTHPPLPLEVIRQMSISKSMRLFDDEEEEGSVPAGESQVPKPALADVPAPVPKSPAIDAVPPDQATESGISEVSKESPV